eukprot:837692-Prorocentrum_minimum.AAC.1
MLDYCSGAESQNSLPQSSGRGSKTASPTADAFKHGYEAAALKSSAASTPSSVDTDRTLIDENFTPEDLVHTKAELARLVESLSEKDPQSLWKVGVPSGPSHLSYDVCPSSSRKMDERNHADFLIHPPIKELDRRTTYRVV